MSVNKVILLGRVGNDPDVKFMPSGNAVVNLSLATNRKFKNQDSGSYEDKTEWHRVVFFNKPAETIGQYVKKGQQLYVEGRLQTRKWQDKDGIEKYSTDIVLIISLSLEVNLIHHGFSHKNKIIMIFQIKI